MKAHPILFSGPMVRAILDGRKTQTRRPINPQPEAESGGWRWAGRRGVARWSGDNPPAACALHHGLLPECPYGEAGNTLWVKERFALGRAVDDKSPAELSRSLAACVWYEADVAEDSNEESWANRGRWRASIHMPRWASRLSLAIESVRVERLFAISQSDAQSEGVA